MHRQIQVGRRINTLANIISFFFFCIFFCFFSTFSSPSKTKQRKKNCQNKSAAYSLILIQENGFFFCVLFVFFCSLAFRVEEKWSVLLLCDANRQKVNEYVLYPLVQFWHCVAYCFNNTGIFRKKNSQRYFRAIKKSSFCFIDIGYKKIFFLVIMEYFRCLNLSYRIQLYTRRNIYKDIKLNSSHWS